MICTDVISGVSIHLQFKTIIRSGDFALFWHFYQILHAWKLTFLTNVSVCKRQGSSQRRRNPDASLLRKYVLWLSEMPVVLTFEMPPKSVVCVCVWESLRFVSTLCDPVDCSPPGSSVHAILQARTVGWTRGLYIISFSIRFHENKIQLKGKDLYLSTFIWRFSPFYISLLFPFALGPKNYAGSTGSAPSSY